MGTKVQNGLYMAFCVLLVSLGVFYAIFGISGGHFNGSGTSALLVTFLLLTVGGYGFWKAFCSYKSLKVEVPVTEDERTDGVDGRSKMPSMNRATSYHQKKAKQLPTDPLTIVVSDDDMDRQERRSQERTSPQ